MIENPQTIARLYEEGMKYAKGLRSPLGTKYSLDDVDDMVQAAVVYTVKNYDASRGKPEALLQVKLSSIARDFYDKTKRAEFAKGELSERKWESIQSTSDIPGEPDSHTRDECRLVRLREILTKRVYQHMLAGSREVAGNVLRAIPALELSPGDKLLASQFIRTQARLAFDTQPFDRVAAIDAVRRVAEQIVYHYEEPGANQSAAYYARQVVALTQPQRPVVNCDEP